MYDYIDTLLLLLLLLLLLSNLTILIEDKSNKSALFVWLLSTIQINNSDKAASW